jgi:hypothetical protein
MAKALQPARPVKTRSSALHDGKECRSYKPLKVHFRRDGSGNYIEPAEMYPCSEQWGDYGWTVLSLDGAYKKLKGQIREKTPNE